MPSNVLVDTNIFIFAYVERVPIALDVLKVLSSADYQLLYSYELQDQIRRVSRRLVGPDATGVVLNRIQTSFKLEWVLVPENPEGPLMISGDLPKEDLAIFLAAKIGNADLMISENREFVRQAAAAQDLFACLSMQEFLERYGEQ